MPAVFLSGLLNFFVNDNPWELHNLGRGRVAILSESGLVSELATGNLGEGYVGVTKPGSIFNKRPVPETKLSNTPGYHVHKNLLIRDNIIGGFNEFGFHN